MFTDAQYPVPINKTWEVIDASKLTCFMECRRKFFYEYVLGLRLDAGKTNHLAFGKAWHVAMEHLLRNGYSKESIQEAHAGFMATYRTEFPEMTDSMFSPKDPGNALLALIQYSQQYERDQFVVLETEVHGTVPIDETGTRLHFRIDSILQDERGIFHMDHKTGSRNSSQWHNQWSLSIQMMTYLHTLYCLYDADSIYGYLVNGAFFKKGGNEFVRVPCRKSLDMMEVWLWTVQELVKEMEREYARLSEYEAGSKILKAFPCSYNSCSNYYGCAYQDFCRFYANPIEKMIVDNELHPIEGYHVEWWDPREEEVHAKKIINL